MGKPYRSIYKEYEELGEQLGDSEEYRTDRENIELVKRAKKLKGRHKLALFRELENRVLDSENTAQSMYRALTRLDITLNNYGKNSYLRKGLEEIRDSLKRTILNYYQPLQQKSVLDKTYGNLETSITAGFDAIKKKLEVSTAPQERPLRELDVLRAFTLTAYHQTENGLRRRKATERQRRWDSLIKPVGIAAGLAVMSVVGWGTHKTIRSLEKKGLEEQTRLMEDYKSRVVRYEGGEKNTPINYALASPRETAPLPVSIKKAEKISEVLTKTSSPVSFNEEKRINTLLIPQLSGLEVTPERAYPKKPSSSTENREPEMLSSTAWSASPGMLAEKPAPRITSMTSGDKLGMQMVTLTREKMSPSRTEITFQEKPTDSKKQDYLPITIGPENKYEQSPVMYLSLGGLDPEGVRKALVKPAQEEDLSWLSDVLRRSRKR